MISNGYVTSHLTTGNT